MTTEALPKTLQEAIVFFSTPWKAHEFMVQMRWNGAVRCPHCDSDKVGAFSGKRLVSNCKACKKQFTVKVGTIFEDSPLSLSKWLPAVWMIVNAKNGVSSYEIHRALGITQKTAWFMSHRIRLALHSGSFDKMTGHVESDETFIGGKSRFKHKEKKAKHTSWMAMTPVQGLLERHSAKGSRVILKVLKGTRRHELQRNVREYVIKGTNVYTDALRSYIGLREDYAHKVIDHAECYAKGLVHTNGLENFWSLLKRSIKGTYVHVAPYHLFRYLDEQAYRFNERKQSDGERFIGAVSTIWNRKLSYAALTGKS